MKNVLSIHHAHDAHLARQRRLGRYGRPATMVGQTPVLRIGAPFTDGERGFWAKLEGFNPGGMKDRPALHMVERARASGFAGYWTKPIEMAKVSAALDALRTTTPG